MKKTLVIFSQTFVPDPASVGQYIADLAVEMARRGHRVRVYASARGYENPQLRYPLHETLNGVEVRRLPFASFGKKSMPLRVLGTFLFQLQCLVVGLFTPADGLVFSTSPPLIGVIATIIHILRGVPIAYWAMDLNPDQLIALGKLKETAPATRLLEALNRLFLRESSLIIALDRFMAERLMRRGDFARKMLVLPPWPHENHLALHRGAPRADNPFRARHHLDGKFVVMYSGNHSPSNPLATLLHAALQFKQDPTIRFLFVGGGSGKKEVERIIAEQNPPNILSLPYQPLSETGHSLSSADVHVVSLGDVMVGIIHPSKIYGAMAVGRPILYLGPRPSHVTDLLDQHNFGLRVAHGDVAGAVRAITQLKTTPPEQLARMGSTAQNVLRKDLGQKDLCGRLCDTIERTLFHQGRAYHGELT